MPGRPVEEFATGRAVGRVLAVERKGDNRDVTLGPAELTDIFEELHISTHQTLDPAKMIAYYAPDYPGTFNDLDAPEEPAARIVRPSEDRNFASLSATTDIRRIRWDGNGSLRSAVLIDTDLHQFRAFKTSIPTAAQFGALTDISLNDYRFSPNCCGGNSGDIKNLNATIQLPMDFSLPIPSIGAPFSVVFRQAIRVTTVFTGKGASIDATGEYEYGGTIRAGIRNGQLIADGPTMGKTVQDLVESLHSHSMGVNAIILGYGAKILVGIGAFDFVVGPYVGVDSTVGTTTSSDAQVGIGFVCRSADVNLWMDVGVGYALPGIVVKALNTFLSLFHAKEIQSTYTKALKSVAIYEGSKAIPPSCGKT